MADYVKTHELDYSQGGDTLDEFAQKYMAEMTRVFRFLNDLRKNTTNSVEYTEPAPNQWKVEDSKIYIRDEDNTEWVYLFDATPYGGIKSNTYGYAMSGGTSSRPLTANDYDVYYDTEAHKMYMWLNNTWALQSSLNAGDIEGDFPPSMGVNATKLKGVSLATEEVQDGQILTYRSASDTWRAENKGTIGTGRALAIYDGGKLVAEFDGDTATSVDIGDWKGHENTPTRVSDTAFTVEGDKTTEYTAGRKVMVDYYGSASPEEAEVVSSTYVDVSDLTTVVLDDDVVSPQIKDVTYNPRQEEIDTHNTSTSSHSALMTAHNADASAHSAMYDNILQLIISTATGTYFYTSGTYTVPAGVSTIYVSGCAGGASGTEYSGGGGGESVYRQAISVTAGEEITVTIGAGGTAYVDSGTSITSGGQNGGNTSFGSYITLTGGKIAVNDDTTLGWSIGKAGGQGATDGEVPHAFLTASSAYTRQGGKGGDSLFGKGGSGGYYCMKNGVVIGTNNPAKAGIGFGSGGGGRGSTSLNGSTVYFTIAGNGANGVIIVETA